LLPAYQVTVITYVMIAAVACIGLVLMTGIVGMVSFGHAAFVGLGAYVPGYLSAQLELSPWLALAAVWLGADCLADFGIRRVGPVAGGLARCRRLAVRLARPRRVPRAPR